MQVGASRWPAATALPWTLASTSFAACSWQRPHLIVLDEPTNYLDRDSLGALSKALKAFEGGVIIITHSSEFTKGLTEEVWSVIDGKMTPSKFHSLISDEL